MNPGSFQQMRSNIELQRVVLELRSEDWGQRICCIEDPNGIHLDIVQAIEPTVEYQADGGLSM